MAHPVGRAVGGPPDYGGPGGGGHIVCPIAIE